MTDRTGASGATPVAGILAGQARKPSEASKVIRRKTSPRFVNGFLADSLGELLLPPPSFVGEALVAAKGKSPVFPPPMARIA
jgi:hypothetical protein